MSSETSAWLIAIVAGLSSGVIAGVQTQVTTYAVVAITVVLAVATALVAWILPRELEAADSMV